MDKLLIGKQIRKARKEKNLSGDKLAALIGKSQSYIIMLENGQRRINADILSAIASALGKPAAFFLQGTEDAKKDSFESALENGLDITGGKIKGLPPHIKNAIKSLIEPYIRTDEQKNSNISCS